MSIHAMVPCWKADIRPNQKLVLLAYADSANADGTDSWPGWKDLAEMTGYSRSTIAGVTKQLITLGLLVQTAAGYRGQCATYDVVLDHPLILKGSKDETLSKGSNSDGERVQNQGERVQDTGERVQPVVPPPSSTTVLTNRPKPSVAETAKDAHDIMAYAIVDGLGWDRDEVPEPQWGRIHTAAKHLTSIGADPSEIPRRVAVYRVNFRGATLTPNALATNWPDLAEPHVPVSEKDVQRMADRERTKQLLMNPPPMSDAQRRALERR